MRLTRALLFIFLSGLLSISIAVARINYGAEELGALVYLAIPIVVMIVSLLLYLLIPKTIVSNKILLTAAIVLNIATGILMRLDFYYHILNL